MDFNLRLNKIVSKDKQTNPKYLAEVIKSDFFYMINNYFEVPFEDVCVEITLQGNNYKISINCVGDRLKTMHALP